MSERSEFANTLDFDGNVGNREATIGWPPFLVRFFVRTKNEQTLHDSGKPPAMLIAQQL